VLSLAHTTSPLVMGTGVITSLPLAMSCSSKQRYLAMINQLLQAAQHD
jgi:hypothetical protein